MALPAGVAQLGTFKGAKGDRGPAGTFASAGATSVAPGASASAVLSGPEGARHVQFSIPRGLPGVNAVPADEAIAAYLAAEGSQSNAAVEALLATFPTSPSAIAAISPDRLVVWGDSIAETGEVDGTSYLALVAGSLGISRFNGAWWGQNSIEIAARQGGRMQLLTFASNTIPASGSVVVTCETSPIGGTAGRGPEAGVLTGTVQGVRGVLSWAGSDLIFTRAAAGEAVVLPGAVPFIGEAARAYRGDVTLLAAGRNGTHILDRLIDAHRGMVQFTNPRFAVLGILPWEGTDPTHTEDPANAALRALWPDRFVDLKAWLMSVRSSHAIAYEFTSGDLAHIAAGFVPGGYRTDGVHPTLRGRHAIAYAVREHLLFNIPDLELAPGYRPVPSPSETPDHSWVTDGLFPGLQLEVLQPRDGVTVARQDTPSARPFADIDAAAFDSPVYKLGTGYNAALTLGTTPAAATTFMIGRLRTIATSKIIASTAGGIFRTNGTPVKWGMTSGGGNFTSAVNADTLPHVFAWVQNGASSSLWVDGVKIATGTLSAPSGTNATWGDVGIGADLNVAGQFVYRSALSDAQIAAISAELMEVLNA